VERETYYEVEDGEDLAWIAFKYGFGDVAPIVEHANNKDVLDSEGRHQGSLKKGDKIFIPDVNPKEFEVETNESHVFQLQRPKMLVHVVLESEEGLVHANTRYELWINDHRVVPEHESEEVVRTTSTGAVHQVVPLAQEVQLRVWYDDVLDDEDEDEDDDEDEDQDDDDDDVPDDASEPDYTVIDLHFGHLAPIGTDEGVQDRLNNLGYTCEGEPGEGSETETALEYFQAEYGLEVTGEADEATRAMLAEVHDGQESDDSGSDAPS